MLTLLFVVIIVLRRCDIIQNHLFFLYIQWRLILEWWQRRNLWSAVWQYLLLRLCRRPTSTEFWAHKQPVADVQGCIYLQFYPLQPIILKWKNAVISTCYDLRSNYMHFTRRIMNCSLTTTHRSSNIWRVSLWCACTASTVYNQRSSHLQDHERDVCTQNVFGKR